MFICTSTHNSRDRNMQVRNIDIKVLFLQLTKILRASDRRCCRKICKLPFLFFLPSQSFWTIDKCLSCDWKKCGLCKICRQSKCQRGHNCITWQDCEWCEAESEAGRLAPRGAQQAPENLLSR